MRARGIKEIIKDAKRVTKMKLLDCDGQVAKADEKFGDLKEKYDGTHPKTNNLC